MPQKVEKSKSRSLLWIVGTLLALSFVAYQFYGTEEKNCHTLSLEAKGYLEAQNYLKAEQAFEEACEKCPEIPAYCQSLSELRARP